MQSAVMLDTVDTHTHTHRYLLNNIRVGGDF